MSPRFSAPHGVQNGELRNFGAVPSVGIPTMLYRSGCPGAANIEHLKELEVQTVMYVNFVQLFTHIQLTSERSSLTDREFAESLMMYLWTSNIQHYRCPLPPNKNGQTVSQTSIAQLINFILYHDDHQGPVLIHCGNGKVN